ncbi:excinuclease ABC subunit UvrA [Candidatus Protochlamydia amoebophila]|uniref:UvrABC system protein A n=1 Tax=Candidatus Protochlamydia amoebophila TaxID=362787 RepID=A0A0C1H2N3_9BACT|nr:excinuclease ABC subunit UvrA [Candidatus Protochlamydia amoebophila]KIC71909.1 UvrABC system protein A [Candidatus Protochlamydia amoebophila]
MMNQENIVLKKVRVHNLKTVDLTLEKNELIVFTGVSGSGKSSLAFDTIYTEGQRRYVESLSTFARRQLGELSKPDLEHASGISPTISIEQKTAGKNPRSTVGTLTEIYDYLRVLYARIGIPHCPVSGEAVTPQSRERIIKSVQNLPPKTKIIILAPYAKAKKAEFKEDFQELIRKGFMRARVDGHFVNLTDELTLDGNVTHDVDVVIDRLTIENNALSRIADSLTQALQLGQGVCSILDAESKNEQLFSMHAYSPQSGLSYSSLEPHDFSFNSPSGMCPRCQGMGNIHEFNLDLVIDPNLSIANNCCSIASPYQTVRYGNIYDNLAEQYHFSVNTPWKKLSASARKVYLFGTEKKWTRMHFVHPITGARWTDHIQWKGVLHDAHTRFSEAKSENYRKKMQKVMSIQICPECEGTRLKPYPAATLLGGQRISNLTSMTISDCSVFFENLKLSPQDSLIAGELLKEIRQRLQFLLEVGLHYLTLERTAPTLSGGEAQRVRLASQIGCGLVGITYILDEPSIGLHPRDNRKLIDTLKHLRDMGNTVIVVEHDEETIWEADRIVDFGPGAGVKGGRILVNGDLSDLFNQSESITGAYLTGRKQIEIPKKRRKASKDFLEIKGAQHHNLKSIDVKIPLGLFVAVTGVSGSGKSSLITDILYPALSNALHGGEHAVGNHQMIQGLEAIDKVIAIDQSPIGRNPRSNPATYIKLFDEIRDLFSQLPESQARGYKAGRFSFNVKEGSCSHCEGMGMIKIDMDFMEDAWDDCPLCKTKRFDSETLSVLYKGKNIHDILEMDVCDALEFFANIPSIKHKLETLSQVGMDYIKLGQASTTLSGGEAQRIKLAKELVRPATGKTLYILDEPTTGLHFHDIKHLLEVLHALVEKGNTVLVIEHNMDVVKTADWIIDLGPEGGAGGGQIIATGNPEKIAKMKTPTGIAVNYALYPEIEKKIATALETSKKRRKTKKQREAILIKDINVIGAEQNNLKQISVTIPREKITVCTGPSGSGKSSLAFETIYAEGQRRYIESLSPYARQFVKQMPKPKVGQVSGLSPAIAIEQKAHAGNPRSTVGTLTEIYDYLRILFSRLGIAHCPETGEVIKSISKELVVERILSYPENQRLQILAPIELNKNEKFEDLILKFNRQGFLRIRLNGEFYSLEQDQINQIPFDRKRKNELFLVIDRLKTNSSIKARLFEAIENATSIGDGKVVVMKEDEDIPFNLSFAVESTGKSYPEITPHTFAFNTHEGMCVDCQGLGYQYGANFARNNEMTSHSVIGLMRHLWQQAFTRHAFAYMEHILDEEGIDPHVPLNQLPIDKIQFLMQGSAEERWYTNASGLRYRWIGIDQVLAKAGKNAVSEKKEAIIPLLQEQTCISCQGARINPLARNVTIHKHSIHDICSMPIEQTLNFIKKLKLSPQNKKLLEEVHTQLINRLSFLCEVGLHYLSLERRAPTLSGGEAQRIRLARQLGSGLTGVLYVLDEPTIGLHPHDNAKLNAALKKLKDLGNTLLMVEHDPLTIETADYLLDFGPASGEHGGHVTARGSFKQILKSTASLTGAYLSGKKRIPILSRRRPIDQEQIVIQHAKKNNLKSINVEIPIAALTCLTGVSGSGKSTLLQQVLLPALEKRQNHDTVEIEGAIVSGLSHFDKVISIDQDPIGTTVRSDVCTYVDVLTRIREFFVSLPAARTKGLQPKNFSYNHRKGMCTGCWGLGYRRVEMHFLPAVKVTCEDCQGLRLNPISLEVTYAGKNLGQYLNTTIDEARVIFQNHPRIVRILDTLIAVGLGYLKLGQETASLSGGEAQRLKLSRELAKRATGRTLYLLDEPTTGLHSDDIYKLLQVLHRLVDKGNTMIIIEHHLDIIKNADYIIDLGPEAGEKGGKVLGKGTPEQIAQLSSSWTGHYLKNVLSL